MIRVEEFSKLYDSTLAVDRLSFEVAPGQILGLIGPNGAGKTTTLRTLAGVLPASSGKLEAAGVDVASSPVEAKRRLAYVADDPPNFSDLTVAEHLLFYASVYAVQHADQRAKRLLAEFELTPKADALARDLSRGMRQKLALCCAYIHDPRAILLDEQMTGLDPPAIRQLKRSLYQRAEQGAAIIVSSHLLAMVDDICTDVLILDQGRMRFMGDKQQLRSQFGSAGAEQSLEEIFFAATCV